MKKLLLSLFAGLFFLSPHAQTTTSGSFMHNGINRSYSLYIPAMYTGSTPVPLVFNLHGYTSNGVQQGFYGDFKPIADTANFIIVLPEGTVQPGTQNTQFWNAGLISSNVDDVGFLETLIDTISAHYNINKKRVYSAGMSNGGFMGYTLACESDRFAAVGSVTGSMSTVTFATCNPQRPTPIIEVHGTADPTVPYNGTTGMKPIEDVVDFWVTENGCNPTPSISNVPNSNTTDGATAEHYVYSGGIDGHTVEFFKVVGGEHTWPGAPITIGVTCRDFSASAELWRFFSQYEHVTAGIGELPTVNFKLYPNPVSEQLFIQLSDKQVTKANVMDMEGRTVIQTKGKNITSIDVSALRAGSYIIEISGEDFISHQKFVVQ